MRVFGVAAKAANSLRDLSWTPRRTECVEVRTDVTVAVVVVRHRGKRRRNYGVVDWLSIGEVHEPCLDVIDCPRPQR